MSIVQKIDFKKDLRCFAKGSSVDFDNSNFVVVLGDNGSGKSTILQVIHDSFKNETFFDRRIYEFMKSCDVSIKIEEDTKTKKTKNSSTARTKKTKSLLLDYLHQNPKNASHFSEDTNEMMIEIQSQRASSGQATQLGLGNRLGSFLLSLKESPSVVLFDQPETSLDVGSMTQICFILMTRLAFNPMQLFVATHSSDWLKAMHIAYSYLEEPIQKKLSFRFIDLSYPEVKIGNIEDAIVHNANKQIEALNLYLERTAEMIALQDKEQEKKQRVKKPSSKKAKESKKASSS